MIAAWLAAVAGWVALPEVTRRRAAHYAMPTGVSRWCWYGAAALLLAISLPPLAGTAHRTLWAQTLQFSLLAFGVAPLAVLGAPRTGTAAGEGPVRALFRTPARAGPAALACFLIVTIGWRVPAAVDAVASGRGWLALEAVTVTGGTWWLWTILLGVSRPGQPRLWRVGLAAVAAWSVWIFAYVLGFSAHAFYPAFAVGRTPQTAQQVTVGLLLVTSALALCPVMFVNLTRWLSADQARSEAEMARYRTRRARIPEHDHD